MFYWNLIIFLRKLILLMKFFMTYLIVKKILVEIDLSNDSSLILMDQFWLIWQLVKIQMTNVIDGSSLSKYDSDGTFDILVVHKYAFWWKIVIDFSHNYFFKNLKIRPEYSNSIIKLVMKFEAVKSHECLKYQAWNCYIWNKGERIQRKGCMRD